MRDALTNTVVLFFASFVIFIGFYTARAEIRNRAERRRLQRLRGRD